MKITVVNGTQTIDELMNRKSVRAFTGEPIPEEHKALILAAATQAPSAGCQQLYTIIDVTDQAIKNQLVDTCDHQPFIAKADLVLIFLADLRKWYEGYCDVDAQPREPGEGDLLLAVTDAAIAAQNAVTAAWSLGIGSCYIGDVMENCEEQRRLLGLPAYVFPAAMVVFGYPTEQQKERPKPKRAAMEYIVSENQYPAQTAADREEMFFGSRGLAKGAAADGISGSRGLAKGASGTVGAASEETSDDPGAAGQISAAYREWMRAFCERKYNSDFSREMTRSVRKYLKDFKKEGDLGYEK